MTLTRRQVLQSTAASALLVGVSQRALAQPAPFETVKIITGFTPGGTSDTTCRRVAAKLAPGYGKSVLVEQIAINTPEGTMISTCYATNVYHKGRSGWHMVLHHASSAPPQASSLGWFDAPDRLH